MRSSRATCCGAPTDWAFDASYILYGTLFMMAGAYALSRNGHVRGDFLYRTWRPRRTRRGSTWSSTSCSSSRRIIAFMIRAMASPRSHGSPMSIRAYSPTGPPIYPVQDAHSRHRRAAAAAGHRRGGALHPLHPHRRLAAAPSDVEELEKIILEQRADRGRQSSMTDPQLGVLMLRALRRAHHARLPDRLHADGDGRGLRLPRLDGTGTRRSLLVQRT